MRSVCQEDRSVQWGLLGKDTHCDGLDLQIVQLVRAWGACEGRNTLVGRSDLGGLWMPCSLDFISMGYCGEGEVN